MSSRKVTGEAIGHPEALRVDHGEGIGWRYIDPDNTVLHEMLFFFAEWREAPGDSHRVNLVELDNFIEQLEAEGAVAGAQLRERRREALRLFREQFRGKVTTLPSWTDCFFATHIEAIAGHKSNTERAEKRLASARKKRAKASKTNAENAKNNRKRFDDGNGGTSFAALIREARLAQEADEFGRVSIANLWNKFSGVLRSRGMEHREEHVKDSKRRVFVFDDGPLPYKFTTFAAQIKRERKNPRT